MTRGLRLNNPGNIRISDTPWQGKLTPSQDAEFETFKTAHDGIRALVKILLTYFNRYKLDTIAGLIAKWAPPSENDTASYAQDVSMRSGYAINEELTPDAETLCDLAIAIIHHENGSCPYSDDEISDGVDSALGVVDAHKAG